MEYPVVIKGDVQGSVEAIVTALNNISTDDIKVRVLLAGVGGITESDMLLGSGVECAAHRLQRASEQQGSGTRQA